jgi:hypothetical protein
VPRHRFNWKRLSVAGALVYEPDGSDAPGVSSCLRARNWGPRKKEVCCPYRLPRLVLWHVDRSRGPLLPDTCQLHLPLSGYSRPVA